MSKKLTILWLSSISEIITKQNTGSFMVFLHFIQIQSKLALWFAFLVNQLQQAPQGLCLFSQDVLCLQCLQWWIINLSKMSR